MTRAVVCELLLLAAQLTMAQLCPNQNNSSCCKDLGPPTITLDRHVIAPSEYNDSNCLNFLSTEGGRKCQLNCSVPCDAYNGPNTLNIHWKFNSSMIGTTGVVRQEAVLNGNPPYALLIFDSFSMEMNGEYICYSFNHNGSDNMTAKVIGPPSIVIQEEPTITDTTVVLRWTKPESFGATIIYYMISYERVDMDSDIITTRLVNTTNDDRSISITHLTPGEIYQFRVAAVNEFGVTGEFDNGVNAEIMAVPSPPTQNPPCQTPEGCITCTLDVSNMPCCSECDTENSFTLDGCDCFKVTPSCVTIEGCLSCSLDDAERICCSECDGDNGYTLDDCSCAVVNEVTSGGLSPISIIAGIVVVILVMVAIIFFIVFILASRYYTTKKSNSELELQELEQL